MKKQLFVYLLMILAFIVYNQFFRVADERTKSLINILFASFLFLYIGYLAFLVLKRMKNSGKK